LEKNMKHVYRSLAVLVLGLAFTACNNDALSSPSSTTTETLTANLSTENEVPPIANEEAGGSATATFTMKLTRDSYDTITAASLDVSVTATGFPPGTALTKAHIHPGPADANGGILVNIGITDGEVTFPSGAGSFKKTAIAVPADQANAILANPGGFYFNIHTARNPDGVARGQLTRVP
jgi:hypothetical protein